MTVTVEQIAAAKSHGLIEVEALAAASDRHQVPFYLACTILSKESAWPAKGISGGANVYGHDQDGVFSIDGMMEVTEQNFAEFRQRIDAGEKSNGVGPMQITWKGFFPDAEKQGLRLWLPAENIMFGVSIIAGFWKASKGDVFAVGKGYNGKESYGNETIIAAKIWKDRVGIADLPAPPVPPPPMRAGTVNLAKFMEWDPRADAVIAEVDSMKLGLIGFQETREEFEADLAERLEGDWLVVSDRVNCPAFARADLYEPVLHNGKSGIPITMPGSVRERYGSAALLRRKADGFTFVFANIHPSNGSESPNSATDRIRQAHSCWKHLTDWGVTQFPILLVGDMNAKQMPPDGLPGVFVKYGMIDVLQALKQPGRIDRAFTKDFKIISATVNPVADNASDHDFGVFVVEPAGPPPPPLSLLARMNATHGRVTQFRVSSFERARKHTADKPGYPSRYTAIMQDWLSRKITTTWSAEDEKVLASKGPLSKTRATQIRNKARAAGKKVYPVVD